MVLTRIESNGQTANKASVMLGGESLSPSTLDLIRYLLQILRVSACNDNIRSVISET